jgi:hypothetical protein
MSVEFADHRKNADELVALHRAKLYVWLISGQKRIETLLVF